MARIFFMAFDSAAQYPLVKKLRNLGHKVAVTEPKAPDFVALLKQQIHAPELFLCDASTRASHAREACNYIRGLRAHQDTPIVLYNVKPEDEAKTRERVLGATLLPDDDVLPTLDAALRAPGAKS